MGVGYTWTPYDPGTHPTAIALGSHLNAAIRLGLGWSGSWGSRLGWQGWLRLTHLSNGGITQPNLGTNQIELALALLYRDSRAGQAGLAAQNSDAKQAHWLLMAQAGLRDLGLPRGPRAILGSARILRLFPDALKQRAWTPVGGAGATIAHRHNGRPPQVFVEAGGLWSYGRVDLLATWGGLLSGVDSSQGPVFLQVDLLGQISPSLALSISLRSYRLRAEHPAVGLVWSM